MLDTRVLLYFYCFYVLVPRIIFKIRISQNPKMEGYSSTSEEESEVTFTHDRCNGTSPNQHAQRTSTPTPSDYMTQGDPNASPSGSFKSHDITNELLGTNNFFVPDGNNRIQLRTLQPQLHPQRLRDHQVVAFDPK